MMVRCKKSTLTLIADDEDEDLAALPPQFVQVPEQHIHWDGVGHLHHEYAMAAAPASPTKAAQLRPDIPSLPDLDGDGPMGFDSLDSAGTFEIEDEVPVYDLLAKEGPRATRASVCTACPPLTLLWSLTSCLTGRPNKNVGG
jgi:hypothetical protein